MRGGVIVTLDALVVAECDQGPCGIQVAAERLGERLGLVDQRRESENGSSSCRFSATSNSAASSSCWFVRRARLL